MGDVEGIKIVNEMTGQALAVAPAQLLELAWLPFALVLVLFWRYLNHKVKNLATKEDVGTITNEIESVRIGFSTQLEGAKAELAARVEYGRVRYERELSVLEGLWARTCTLLETMRALNPTLDTSVGPEQEEQRTRKRAQACDRALSELKTEEERLRPFFAPEISNGVRVLLDQCWKGGILEALIEGKLDWVRTDDARKDIEASAEQLCTRIRQRLATFDVVNKSGLNHAECVKDT